MSDKNETNDQLVLIVGESSTGKSASLRNLKDQPSWAYFNSEAGKRLPFKNKFNAFRIEDPYQIFEGFDHFTNDSTNKGAIIDSITFLMDMFETNYVLNQANTMQGWSNYAQYFKILLQDKITRYGKPVIITAHTRSDLDEKAMEMKVSVPIKGALKNNGVEAYFSTVVAAKKISIKDLEPYKSDLLSISDEERELGYKHVFQTRPTKATVGERIRSPMGMFDKEQTYMDNDAQVLLNHLHDFYS